MPSKKINEAIRSKSKKINEATRSNQSLMDSWNIEVQRFTEDSVRNAIGGIPSEPALSAVLSNTKKINEATRSNESQTLFGKDRLKKNNGMPVKVRQRLQHHFG